MAALYFDARIDGTKLQADIAAINKKLEILGRTAQQQGRVMDKSLGGVGKAADDLKSKFGGDLKSAVFGFFALSAGTQLIQSIVKVRGEFQQLEVAFKTMLGSKKEADSLMAEVVDFAARTPFELSDVASGAKGLLAYGVAAKDIIPTLKSLGDVSAGLSVPMERLILNFGQIKTQGELTGRELRDFSVAGVPMVAELAKNLNKAESEIQEMVSKGKIGFKDVEQAFITMSSAGGRFANMMDAQSKTVTGQISNMKDAWAQMLNEIGKGSEGAIYGAVNITKGLIENYEKIIDTLKILVVTYGAYKTAVIATAVASNASNMAATIKAWISLAKGITSAKDAQALFNLTTKANPIGLAVAGITALVAVLGTMAYKTKSTTDHIQELTEATAGITKQDKSDELVKRYEELSKETKLTAEQQEELKRVIIDLGNIYPNAIRGVNAYGDAIELNAQRITQLNNSLRENEIVLTEKSLGESERKLNGLKAKIDYYLTAINTGKIKLTDSDTGAEYSVTLSDKAISRYRKKLKEATEEAEKLQTAVDGTKKAMREMSAPEVDQELAKYAQLFGGIARLTDDQAKERKKSLEGLLGEAISEGAKERVQKELDEINKLLETPINVDQITKLREELAAAQAESDRVNADSTRSTAEQRKAAADNLQGIKDQLKARGIEVDKQGKNEKKAAEETIKAEQEKQKALQELMQLELQLRNQTEADIIAIKQDGRQKQLAEAKLAYDMEMQQIAELQKEMAQKYSESIGKTDAAGELVLQELPQDKAEAIEKQKALVAEKYAARRVEIEQEANKQIAEIRATITDAFLSNQQREIAAVESKYKELEEALRKNDLATDSDRDRLRLAKEQEINQIRVNNAIATINFEEEIAIRTIEIQNRSVTNTAKVEQQKLVIFKQKAKERITELAKLNTQEANQEIEILKKSIAAWDQDFKELSFQASRNVVDSFRGMASAVGEVDEALGKTLDTIGKLAENALGAFAGFASGNIAGAITGSIGVLASVFEILKKDEEPDALSRTLETVNRNLEIQANLLASLNGEDWFALAAKQAEEYGKAVATNVKLLQDAKIYTSERYNDLYQDFKEKQRDFPGFWGTRTFSYYLEGIKDDTSDWSLSQFYDAWANNLIHLSDAQKEILSDAYAALQSQNKLMEESWDKVTASSQDSIADSIIQGFREGYQSAEDFAENFEELMKNALVNSIRNNILSSTGKDSLNDWYKNFYELGKDGLSEDDINLLRTGWDAMVQKQKELYDNANAILNLGSPTGESSADKAGLSGAIKGITEETADLIAGRFTAFLEFQIRINNSLDGLRMTAGLQMDEVTRATGHLAEIASNTRHNSKLITMSDQLADMINILKAKL